MGIYVLIDVLPLVAHELISGHTVHPGTIHEHVKGVAAVMRRVLCPDPAGLQGSFEAFPVLGFRDGPAAVVVDQAFEPCIQSAAYHLINGGMYGHCPVAAVAVLQPAGGTAAEHPPGGCD